MTTITAKVIADSISPQDIRLTTMQLRYPKCVHGEAKTHRQMRIADRAYEILEEVGFMNDPNLSRNASSSRAIPVERLIKDVMDDPYIPIHWGKNQKGMQAAEECGELIHIGGMWFNMEGSLLADDTTRERAWLLARDNAVKIARAFSEAGYHKQIVNRLLEPWCHINVVVTATEWSNFFALRDHEDAQPEIRMLAQAMKKAMAKSRPKLLQPGDWHLPYVGPLQPDESMRIHIDPNMDDAILKAAWETAIHVSVARCARVSYLTQEGKTPSIDEDLKLYERLVDRHPIHVSPAEHQATPDEIENVLKLISNEPVRRGDDWKNKHLHGNFHGWIQYRKTLPGECQ